MVPVGGCVLGGSVLGGSVTGGSVLVGGSVTVTGGWEVGGLVAVVGGGGWEVGATVTGVGVVGISSSTPANMASVRTSNSFRAIPYHLSLAALQMAPREVPPTDSCCSPALQPGRPHLPRVPLW